MIQEKKSRIRGKTTKMISDREDKKMARFLPLKKEDERKYRYCRSCKFNLRHCKNNLTQELRY
jgi:hypothetical protein